MRTDDLAPHEGGADQSGITDPMAEAAALRGLCEALAEFSRVRASILAPKRGQRRSMRVRRCPRRRNPVRIANHRRQRIRCAGGVPPSFAGLVPNRSAPPWSPSTPTIARRGPGQDAWSRRCRCPPCSSGLSLPTARGSLTSQPASADGSHHRSSPQGPDHRSGHGRRGPDTRDNGHLPDSEAPVSPRVDAIIHPQRLRSGRPGPGEPTVVGAVERGVVGDGGEHRSVR